MILVPLPLPIASCGSDTDSTWASPPHCTILRHQPGTPRFNSTLTLSTQRQCPIPHIKGPVPQDCPLPQTPITSQVLLTERL